jgi:hypothetical protein
MLQTIYMRASFLVDDEAPVSAQKVETKILTAVESIPGNVFKALFVMDSAGNEYDVELIDFEAIPPHQIREVKNYDSIFLDAEEAARFLGPPFTKKYLDEIRNTSKGPRFVKPPSCKPGAEGRLVAYRRSDLKEWAASLDTFANTTEVAIHAARAS